MSKKLFISLAIVASMSLITTNSAQANYNQVDAINAGTRIMSQSPVYVDDIGRSHFLSRGGYTSVRKIQNGQAVNDAISGTSEIVDKNARIENRYKNAEKKVSNVEFGEPEEDAFYFPSTASYFEKVKNNYDTSSNYPVGVNNSKTIYTDEIGRQHFFGKANLIK